MCFDLQFFLLVHLGCYNTVNGMAYTQQKFNSHFWGLVPAWLGFSENAFLGPDYRLLTLSSHARQQREEASSLTDSCKDTKFFSWGLHSYVFI